MNIEPTNGGRGPQGGAAIYVKINFGTVSRLEQIEFQVDDPPVDPNMPEPKCETIWIKIELEDGRTLIVGSIYRHPKNRYRAPFLGEFSRKLKEAIENIQVLVQAPNKTIYFMGVFNVDIP